MPTIMSAMTVSMVALVVCVNSLSWVATSERHTSLRRLDEEKRLQALAAALFAVRPAVARSSPMKQSFPASRNSITENSHSVVPQIPGSTRTGVARMAAATTTDKRTEMANAGKLAAEWAIANSHGEATIAVSGATSLAVVLRDFWKAVRRFAKEPGDIGRERILVFPMWKEGHDSFKLHASLMRHISDCAELCRYLGTTMTASGVHPDQNPTETEPTSPPYFMIVMRSNVFKEVKYKDDLFAELPDKPMPEWSSPELSEEDEEILRQTRAWVKGVIVDMKVCPFSSTVDKAGIPQGGVTYPISQSKIAEGVYQDFWEQVLLLRATDPHDVATVLLITPRFSFYSPGGYDVLQDSLNMALEDELMQFENELQLVFFHPEYVIRDGKGLMENAGAAHYARRSPFPMINLLRTPQVRNAQKGLPTGHVYGVNAHNLETVGRNELEKMLQERNWDDLHGRKYMKHTDGLENFLPKE